MTVSITLNALTGMPLVEPDDDVVQLILDAMDRIEQCFADGDVLVIAQKIISKSQNRYQRLADVSPSEEAKLLAIECDKDPRLVEIILGESKEVVKTRPGVIIVEHNLGYVHANAGIDRSNIDSVNEDERVLLLPKDSDASAREIRQELQQRCGCDVKVIINDSAGRAWRNGTVGFTIGCAGFDAVVDLVGKKDLFGRTLEVTQVAVADELAAAASFLMGQSDEGVPAVIIKGADLPSSRDENSMDSDSKDTDSKDTGFKGTGFKDIGSTSLIRAKSEDLFRD